MSHDDVGASLQAQLSGATGPADEPEIVTARWEIAVGLFQINIDRAR